jgi:hypothetical protein
MVLCAVRGFTGRCAAARFATVLVAAYHGDPGAITLGGTLLDVRHDHC